MKKLFVCYIGYLPIFKNKDPITESPHIVNSPDRQLLLASSVLRDTKSKNGIKLVTLKKEKKEPSF